MSSINVNLHTIFHDCLGEYDRFKFLKEEVANLTIQQQAELVLEAFGKMQDYINIDRMSVEVLHDDRVSVTTFG